MTGMSLEEVCERITVLARERGYSSQEKKFKNIEVGSPLEFMDRYIDDLELESENDRSCLVAIREDLARWVNCLPKNENQGAPHPRSDVELLEAATDVLEWFMANWRVVVAISQRIESLGLTSSFDDLKVVNPESRLVRLNEALRALQGVRVRPR